MTANAAGPVMTLYLSAAGIDKRRFVGTSAWFFLIVNLAKVPFSIGLGLMQPVDVTRALVLSQVVLSLGIPFALIPLVRLTGDRTVMGRFAARLPLRLTSWMIVVLIVALNLALIALMALGLG